MEPNREQIEHTLEICSSGDEQCAYCCLLAFDGCARKLAKLALALIRELTDEVAKAKADTVREMQERLKYTLCINNEENTDFFDYEYTLETIDQTAKELLEESNET